MHTLMYDTCNFLNYLFIQGKVIQASPLSLETTENNTLLNHLYNFVHKILYWKPKCVQAIIFVFDIF